MANAALILAAGRGTRIQELVADKILTPLAGRPAFLYSIEAFRQSGSVKRIAILYRDESQRTVLADALRAAGLSPADFTWTAGGSERCESVLNGLRALPAETDLVFIHDAARPLLPPATIRKLADTATQTGAACLARRVTDTIKVSPQTETSTPAPLQTVDRSKLWAVETPQVFRHALILQAYERTTAAGERITDDTAALERSGHPVALVENPNPNPKLTTPADLRFIEYLLKSPTESLQ